MASDRHFLRSKFGERGLYSCEDFGCRSSLRAREPTVYLDAAGKSREQCLVQRVEDDIPIGEKWNTAVECVFSAVRAIVN